MMSLDDGAASKAGMQMKQNSVATRLVGCGMFVLCFDTVVEPVRVTGSFESRY